MTTTKEYISVAETAKFVRKALAHNFPKTKFSVRSKSYSGGASISIYWTDGPTGEMVKRVSDRYEGADFDGMQDLKTHKETLLVGSNGMRSVHFGADFIFAIRKESNALVQFAIDAVYEKYIGNFEREKIAKPTVDDYQMGRTWGLKLGENFAMDFVQHEIRSVLSTTIWG